MILEIATQVFNVKIAHIRPKYDNLKNEEKDDNYYIERRYCIY